MELPSNNINNLFYTPPATQKTQLLESDADLSSAIGLRDRYLNISKIMLFAIPLFLGVRILKYLNTPRTLGGIGVTVVSALAIGVIGIVKADTHLSKMGKSLDDIERLEKAIIIYKEEERRYSGCRMSEVLARCHLEGALTSSAIDRLSQLSGKCMPNIVTSLYKVEKEELDRSENRFKQFGPYQSAWTMENQLNWHKARLQLRSLQCRVVYYQHILEHPDYTLSRDETIKSCFASYLRDDEEIESNELDLSALRNMIPVKS
jgi:hypothetical protein